jgi:hypothetical protein
LSRRYYADHPDYAGEVDHAAQVDQLTGYDGWALSTSAAAPRQGTPSDHRWRCRSRTGTGSSPRRHRLDHLRASGRPIGVQLQGDGLDTGRRWPQSDVRSATVGGSIHAEILRVRAATPFRQGGPHPRSQ